jgi:hypothetical protein
LLSNYVENLKRIKTNQDKEKKNKREDTNSEGSLKENEQKHLSPVQ